MTEVIYEGIENVSEKMKYQPLEQYTLILKHEFIDSDGKKHQIDEPIFVKQIISNESLAWRHSVVVNDMLERMRAYLLMKVREKE